MKLRSFLYVEFNFSHNRSNFRYSLPGKKMRVISPFVSLIEYFRYKSARFCFLYQNDQRSQSRRTAKISLSSKGWCSRFTASTFTVLVQRRNWTCGYCRFAKYCWNGSHFSPLNSITESKYSEIHSFANCVLTVRFDKSVDFFPCNVSGCSMRYFAHSDVSEFSPSACLVNWCNYYQR